MALESMTNPACFSGEARTGRLGPQSQAREAASGRPIRTAGSIDPEPGTHPT